MKEKYQGECKYCKDKGESFIVRGSNEKDVKDLIALHIAKCHKKQIEKDLEDKNTKLVKR